jgi:glycosyltransferase involved in cell wall biosynthesis
MSPDDSAKLADALEGLAANRQRVKELSRRSRDLAVRKYTWRRAVNDTFAEIEKVRSERRQPALKAAL